MNTSFSSFPHSPIMPPVSADDMARVQKDKQKKPRHRHSPGQLAALNELFEKNEHPSLPERTALAGEIAMEVKTVNAWFQNKRASSRKRPRTGTAYEIVESEGPKKARSNASSTPTTPFHPEEELADDDYSYTELPARSRAASHDPLLDPRFFSGHAESNNPFTESEPTPRRMRMRPSAEQTDELRRLYNANPHPTKEEREELGERIGMKYQSITNWFQNQRSIAKKKREEETEALPGHRRPAPVQEASQESRGYSSFPPASRHPSLTLPPPTSHPSLAYSGAPRSRRSISPPRFAPKEMYSPRRPLPRRSSTPYSSSATSLSRPRRTRPEPYQLEALKKLFNRTATPSIEERSALALEIGMDVGKVTNWFRNLRQTERKRSKRVGGDDDGEHDGYEDHDDYRADHHPYSSREGSPSMGSSASSHDGRLGRGHMDMDIDAEHPHHSDMDSEDEYEEAVTPSPEPSPSPPPTFEPSPNKRRRNNVARKTDIKMLGMVVGSPRYKTRGGGPSVTPTEDDARLLLSFHEAVVS